MFPFSPRDSPLPPVILNGFHMELWSGLVSHVTGDTSSAFSEDETFYFWQTLDSMTLFDL